MKTCTMCKESKPLAEYYADPRLKSKIRSRCKSCCNKTMYAINAKTTAKHVEKAAKKQKYKCAICGRKKRLVRDHNHRTGLFRGLLCYSCNSGLGMFQDSQLILWKAILYLKVDRARGGDYNE